MERRANKRGGNTDSEMRLRMKPYICQVIEARLVITLSEVPPQSRLDIESAYIYLGSRQAGARELDPSLIRSLKYGGQQFGPWQ